MSRPPHAPAPILGLDAVELRVLDQRAWLLSRPAVAALQEWAFLHDVSLADFPAGGVILRHPNERAVSATQVLYDSEGRQLVDRRPGERVRPRAELVRVDGLDEVLPWPEAVLALPHVPPRRPT